MHDFLFGWTQVYSLQQGRRDVETVFTMGIMEDVNLVPQPAGGEFGCSSISSSFVYMQTTDFPKVIWAVITFTKLQTQVW